MRLLRSGNRDRVLTSTPRSGDGLHLAIAHDDALGRSVLARALVGAGATVVATAGSLHELVANDVTGAHLLVCDLDAPCSFLALLRLVGCKPDLAIVAQSDASEVGEEKLELVGARHYRVLKRDARPVETVTSILGLWRATRVAGSL